MLDGIKRVIEPPYNSRDLYSIFVAVFIMLLIPLTVLQATTASDNRSSAAAIAYDRTINVEIISPKNNDTVNGTVEVNIQASEPNNIIASVSLYVNNQLLAEVKNPNNDTVFTAKIPWDTSKTTGKDSLTASAIDQSGKQNISDKILVYNANQDVTPPTVSFTNINDGDYLSGNKFLVKIEASDDTKLSLVELSLDGTVIKKFYKFPYQFSLDLTKLQPGNHILKVSATDDSGNSSNSQVQVYRGVKDIKN